MKFKHSNGVHRHRLEGWSPAGGRAGLASALLAFVVITTTWCTDAMAGGLSVAGVSASANDGNVPANTLDGSLSTRWSASGDGQWILFDLGASQTVGAVSIAWYKGDQRSSLLEIQTSANASTWTTVFAGASSGKTAALESYDFNDSAARYVRIVGHGNSQNLWNSISETEIHGAGSGSVTNTPPPPPPPPPPTNALP